MPKKPNVPKRNIQQKMLARRIKNLEGEELRHEGAILFGAFVKKNGLKKKFETGISEKKLNEIAVDFFDEINHSLKGADSLDVELYLKELRQFVIKYAFSNFSKNHSMFKFCELVQKKIVQLKSH